MNHDKEEDHWMNQKRKLKRKQMWRVIRQICRCERCEDADEANYNICISYQSQNHSWYQCPGKTALTPTQAPTATSTMWLQLVSYHDTFWLLHIHESMQCTAELPKCAGHALRCCWHTFVYPHKLQNHNITAVFDVQRPFRAKQLKVWSENHISSSVFSRSTSVSCKSVQILEKKTYFCPFRAKSFKF